MRNEFICSSCGCQDVKIVTQTKTVYRRFGWLSAIFLFVAVIIFLVAMFVFFLILVNAPSEASNLEELAQSFQKLEDYFNFWKWALILSFFGLMIGMMILLFNFSSDYKTETQVIAVCPDCGKTWVIDINVDALKEDKH